MTIQVIDTDELKEDKLILGEGQNLIKASLFNLIVLSQDPERAQHCEELISIIIEKFPCKIIFVRLDPNTQGDYTRTVHNVLSIGTGTSRVLCDQITIEASMNQFAKIPFLILPHIAPDLSVYVLLGHDPAQDKGVLSQIKRYATKVIFDPEDIDNLSKFSQRILAILQECAPTYMDMNWGRVKAWRDVIARAFHAPKMLEQLTQSKMIQINYVGPPNQKSCKCEIQAIYLQAWLAAKLKWTFISVAREEGFLRIYYKFDHQALTVSLVPKDTELLEPGAVFSFESLSHGDYHTLISHENDNKLVKVHASNPELCEIPYTIFFTDYQRGPALMNEVFYSPRSEHYRAMLEMLSLEEWNKAT